ncbi:Pao retrotransposon peptidase [Ancylostoma ceylanicum]|uniref:Pao retrotransposon peptidase n=2 Tax=Ancylostoma ceylanicum TaxID=53326 RepID=A0A0D6M2U5_9BILA|nr:Pao retrotransposon peptidase [Ancylostoma ceylanicum]EYC39937.1 hypothetical protein Y032_0636g942 [Ancylostoma ceylanicum]
MSAQLRTQKRLLTTFTNKLEHIVSKLKDEKLEELPLDPNLSSALTHQYVTRLEEAISAINSAIVKVEKSLNDFNLLIDRLNESSTSEQDEYDEYSCKSESALSYAFDFIILLQARLHAINSCTYTAPPRLSATDDALDNPAQTPRLQTKRIELPPLPIPSFGGNIWEWENFWEIFQNNIHSQDIPELVKYNYLLNALKGEARECIKKFQVTKDNYSKAVEFLLSKYNKKEILINNLIEQLDACTLRSPSIRDQRSLLEREQVIITQLAEKGEQVNSHWLIKKVLAKFPDTIKRKVISKKQGRDPDTPFTMETLFKYVDEILSTEEMFLLFSEKRPIPSQKVNNIPRKSRISQAITPICIYCRGNHTSFSCTKYATPQERSSYLRQHQLCLICASSKHITAECKGRLCFNCNGTHHTSCCFKANANQKPSTLQQKPETKGASKPITKVHEKAKAKASKAGVAAVQSNSIPTPDNAIIENEKGQSKTVFNTQVTDRPYLLSGEITVMNNETRAMSKVDVLLDTGAETSFIDSSLAASLHLPILEHKIIRIHTFGSKESKQEKCGLVKLEGWDEDGTLHSLELLTYDVLTSSFSPVQMSIEDRNFIKSLDISLPTRRSKKFIKPLILIGCDQLWSFMRCDKSPITLPSGLYLLPTKLGAIVSGKAKSTTSHKDQPIISQMIQLSPWANDINNWDRKWSMDEVEEAKVYTIKTMASEITQEEKDQWDQYWTMDNAGTEEFCNTEKEVRATLDKKVWQYFNETIQRREDGYYVRLPWKDQYQHLPDNKALAQKRLANVWSSLKKDENILNQYNNVFQEQLQNNIIEVVDEAAPTHGNQVHYIPHQPVFTPHKATTKLRIVFDASAHYKGCPSLNDVLYRGPVILPSLYGILLRFRIGRIAIIADVEKAFLQVRLQEVDRDATRCLWLKNHNSPPTVDNIQTFRFTRVTFGIKSSPFLLAGTTYYHLDNNTKETSMAQEIKENLYVDNLILTTDTLEGAVNIYDKSKKMFQEIHMNLREFTSNSTLLTEELKASDRATQQCPKVLGIVWNAPRDVIQLSCHIPIHPKITKRVVMSTIAAIYDPLGWLVPLLLQAKIFLQELWKQQYDWDVPLPNDKKQHWQSMVNSISGFEKDLPRFLAPKGSTNLLVAFSDASSNTMAACVYLYQNNGANLIMAKSKLASIQVQYTIPKLELNATTLAMRLTNSLLSQLQSVVNIQGIHVFSDSEIVLKWLQLKPEREVGQFIHNRLKEIRNICNHITEQNLSVQFGYVASQDNPADCGTRGLSRDELTAHFWWTGPSFLQLSRSNWPERDKWFSLTADDKGDDLPNSTGQQPKQILTISKKSSTEDDRELIKPGQVRTWTKAKRVFAYALRFVITAAAKLNTRRVNKIVQDRVHYPLESIHLNGQEVQLAGRASSNSQPQHKG